jgi:hypothetical protein
MKVVFVGDRDRAMKIWMDEPTRMDDFIEHVLDNIQVTHEEGEAILFEGIEPDKPYEMRFGKTLTADTFGPSDGSPTRNTGIDLTDIEAARAAVGARNTEALCDALDINNFDYEANKNQEQRWRLEQLFDDVFISAIRSGLLVEKALVKACEAIEHYDHIESARNRYIDAQLAKGTSNGG